MKALDFPIEFRDLQKNNVRLVYTVLSNRTDRGKLFETLDKLWITRCK